MNKKQCKSFYNKTIIILISILTARCPDLQKVERKIIWTERWKKRGRSDHDKGSPSKCSLSVVKCLGRECTREPPGTILYKRVRNLLIEALNTPPLPLQGFKSLFQLSLVYKIEIQIKINHFSFEKNISHTQ